MREKRCWTWADTAAKVSRCRGKRSAAAKRGLFAAVLLAAVIDAGASESPNAAVDSAQIGHGRYMIKVAGCNDCHTAGYAQTGGKVPESQWLMGNRLAWRGPWGTTYAVNLRLLMSSLTQEQWMALARNSHPRPPMPWWLLRDMSQDDLQAVYAYVKWLGPAGEPAPSDLPPGQEAAGPVVQFPE